MLTLTPRSTLFPYTTLFRSQNKYPNSIALVQKMGQCFEKWNSGANCSEYQPTVNTMSGYNPKNNLGISALRSEEHTSELQSRPHLVCRLLLEKKKNIIHLIV